MGFGNFHTNASQHDLEVCVIKPFILVKNICHKSYYVAFNGAKSLFLHLENPFTGEYVHIMSKQHKWPIGHGNPPFWRIAPYASSMEHHQFSPSCPRFEPWIQWQTQDFHLRGGGGGWWVGNIGQIKKVNHYFIVLSSHYRWQNRKEINCIFIFMLVRA